MKPLIAALTASSFGLLSCATVAPTLPIAGVNAAFVQADMRAIGNRSAPVNAGVHMVAEGHSVRGLIRLSPDQLLFVVPYNSVREREAARNEAFFGVGIKFVADYREQGNLSTNLGLWAIQFPDGRIERPVGYRLARPQNTSPCTPGYRPSNVLGLTTPDVQITVEVRGGSTGCLEIFYAVPPPSPDLPYSLMTGAIHKGLHTIPGVEVAFGKYYGS